MFGSGVGECICPTVKCKRHGKCSECMKFHEKKKSPPQCKRGEKASGVSESLRNRRAGKG